jgi:hypothetical protein
MITVIYIWVLLSIFALHREIILRSCHINYPAKFAFAFINAVILAKFRWLGEILDAGKKAAGKALLHSTLWNAALFAVILRVSTFWRKCLSESGTAALSPQVFPKRSKRSQTRGISSPLCCLCLWCWFLSFLQRG